jgi:hypothetical protein
MLLKHRKKKKKLERFPKHLARLRQSLDLKQHQDWMLKEYHPNY